MTIPTRPAPPPPQVSMTRSENRRLATPISGSLMSNVNFNQPPPPHLQENIVTVPKLTIKLPPPVKSSATTITTMSSSTNNTHFENCNGGNNSITRNFPKARYTPSSDSINNWSDKSSFNNIIYVNSNASSDRINNCTKNIGDNNFVSKKVPPPRPPPPKLMSNGRKGNAPKVPLQPPSSLSLQQSKNILNQIFYRKKKDFKTPIIPVTKSLSSGSQFSRTTSTTSSTLTNNNNIGYGLNGTNTLKNGHLTNFTTNDWNSAWNSNLMETTTISPPTNNELQLINFDSPPSSPTFTQKSNSDCLSMDSFSSDSNFSLPNNGSVSQPESGFEDEFSVALARSRPATTSPPKDPWEAIDISQSSSTDAVNTAISSNQYCRLGTVPVRNLNNIRLQTNSKSNGGIDNPLCNGKSLLPPPPILQMPTIIKPRIAQKPKAPKPPATTTPALQKTAPSLPTFSDFLPPPNDKSARVDDDSKISITKSSVTLLDVISGKADALQLVGIENGMDNGDSHHIEVLNHENPFGIALYDFDSNEIGDLCFRENEKIYLLEKVNAEWYRGRNRSGCEGIFPANYITVKVPLAETHINDNNNGNKNSTNSTISKKIEVKSLYNFPAEVEGDLQLQEDEMVKILYRINQDWLYGETSDGRRGQFPANFLEYVPDNIPSTK